MLSASVHNHLPVLYPSKDGTLEGAMEPHVTEHDHRPGSYHLPTFPGLNEKERKRFHNFYRVILPTTSIRLKNLHVYHFIAIRKQ